MIYAAIAAGGTGTRMGAQIPKQYLEIGGIPIIVRTIKRFAECALIDEIYVGANPDRLGELEKMCREHKLDMSRIFIVGGGSDRNSTVFSVIDEIKKRHDIADSDIILTHDGVRPFVTEEIISENIAAMRRYDGAATSLPSTDTIFVSSDDGNIIDSVPDRARMLRAQTPQTFRLGTLISAYASLTDGQRSKLTDSAGILLLAGIPVTLVRGDERNIKITTPFDMRLGELIAQTEK